MSFLREENDRLKAVLKSIQGSLKGILIQQPLKKSTEALINREIKNIQKEL